jgi:hypothetical protein
MNIKLFQRFIRFSKCSDSALYFCFMLFRTEKTILVRNVQRNQRNTDMLSSNYRPKWKKAVCWCRHRPKIKGSKRILTSPKPSWQNLWNRGWIKKCPGRSKSTNFMSFNRVVVKKFSPCRLVRQRNSTANPRGNSLGRDVRNSLFQRKKKPSIIGRTRILSPI